MNKLLRGLVLVGLLGLVLGVVAVLGARSASRGALRSYEAGLRANGERLTFAELSRGRNTNALDSYSVITNAAASLGDGLLNPGLLEPRKFLRPGQAIVTWREPDLNWIKVGASGRGGTWEEFNAQMLAAGSSLREIREALKEPALDAGPLTNVLVGRRLNFVAIRKAAQWLVGASENDLHQGRLEEALQNLEALGGLARMERDEYTLVAQMIRVAVAGLGLSVTWEALQAPGWTEPQLGRLQRAWEQVDLVEAVESGFVGVRAEGYELFALLRRYSGPQQGRFIRKLTSAGSSTLTRTIEDVGMDYLYLPAYKLTCIDEDELFFLRSMQESLGSLRLLKAHRPWGEAKQGATEAIARINQASISPRRYRYFVSLMAIPNYARAGEKAVQTETERQMTLAAIALKRFQLRHGKLPASLDALVPEFLAAVPYDYMSAMPLCYHQKASGGYALYSVGEDEKDDGGDATPPPGGRPGFWEGRDAVWPSHAAEPDEPPPPPVR
jgi:hypothetical protein